MDIKKFVKNSDGNSIGVVLAKKLDNGTFNISFTCVKPNSNDIFNKKFGLEIAEDKVLSNGERTKNVFIPKHIINDYLVMVKRATKYFKNCKPSPRVEKVINDHKNLFMSMD